MHRRSSSTSSPHPGCGSGNSVYHCDKTTAVPLNCALFIRRMWAACRSTHCLPIQAVDVERTVVDELALSFIAVHFRRRFYSHITSTPRVAENFKQPLQRSYAFLDDIGNRRISNLSDHRRYDSHYVFCGTHSLRTDSWESHDSTITGPINNCHNRYRSTVSYQ